MANPLGVFHPELVPEGWFDPQQKAAGWFDDGNIDATAASGGTQTLTGTLFSDSDSFGAGVISTAITLTGTLFSDGDSFGAGTVSQAGGAQTITGTLFTNTNSFGSGVVSATITVTGTAFTSPNSFGEGTVTGGASATTAGGTSSAVRRQRQRRRLRVLQQLRDGQKPPVEDVQEAIETAVEVTPQNVEASTELLTEARAYIATIPQQSSAEIILALATLAELEMAIQAARAQIEEEESMAFLLLAA